MNCQKDIIFFQRISGGWEYLYYSSCGETYRGFGYEKDHAKAKLLRHLGWRRRRIERAVFLRF